MTGRSPPDSPSHRARHRRDAASSPPRCLGSGSAVGLSAGIVQIRVSHLQRRLVRDDLKATGFRDSVGLTRGSSPADMTPPRSPATTPADGDQLPRAIPVKAGGSAAGGNRVPHGGGQGSSSTIVSGLLAGRALLPDPAALTDDILQLATDAGPHFPVVVEPRRPVGRRLRFQNPQHTTAVEHEAARGVARAPTQPQSHRTR